MPFDLRAFLTHPLISALMTTFLAGCPLVGCATWQTAPPIEAFADRVFDAVEPAITEGLTQGVKSLQIQAGAQAINPTYKMKFSGLWVVGVIGDASIGVEGLAGQMQVSSISTEDTKPSPASEPPPASVPAP